MVGAGVTGLTCAVRLLAEEFIARESFGAEGSDPTAPPAADEAE